MTVGTHVQRIYRQKGFWNTVFPKLKAFYYYFLLPTIVDGEIIKEPIKSCTIKTLKLLENGLVSDYKYYLTNISKRVYVGFYSNVTCEVKEITNEDLATLNGTQWLNSFIIDICFDIFNSMDLFNLVSCTMSTNIIY